MIQSMTGFGSSICTLDDSTYTIDIKSINSKTLDLVQKLPSALKNKENSIRTIIAQYLDRGKIDVTITAEAANGSDSTSIDEPTFHKHYNEIKALADKTNTTLSDADIFNLIFKMPDTFCSKKETIDEETWQQLTQAIAGACQLLNENRAEEGKELEKDFRLRISLISKYLDEVELLENNRVDLIRNRIEKQLATLEQPYDNNRFEQEMIYYLEKFDFTEEKVRLRKHCSYFLDTINTEDAAGKKLSFISQEIGREINTLGSKASDADIQKLVVMMKDELEKIKEQLANVL